MIPSLITTENILFTLSVAATIFAVYRYFHDPDVTSDKQIALIQQQINDDRSGNDRRFKDVQDNFAKVNEVIREHIVSDHAKFQQISEAQISMGKDLTRIATVLEERLPPKQARR